MKDKHLYQDHNDLLLNSHSKENMVTFDSPLYLVSEVLWRHGMNL
jgi:hypothetical protein